MLKTIAVALAVSAVSAVTLVLPASPSSAVAAVDKADRRGDVETEGSTQGIDPAIVSSVDLRHLTVTHQRDGLRVVVRLARVLPVRGRWFQELVFSTASDVDDSSEFELLQAQVVLQHVGAANGYLITATDSASGEEDGEGGGDEPVTCHLTASKGDKRVRLDIPRKCLPKGDGPVVVFLALVDKHGLADPFMAYDQVTAGFPFGSPVSMAGRL